MTNHASLGARLLRWLDAGSSQPPDADDARLAAECWLAVTQGEPSDDAAGLLAAEFEDAFLESIEGSAEAPADLVEAASRVLRHAQVTPFPARARQSAPVADVFRLKAAASPERDEAIFCRSESGLWTLEVFVGAAPNAGDRAFVLLSVDPDYRASYEGRRARVFVTSDGEERVLAEGDIQDGALYAEISIAGLDLRTRDAISVVFAASVQDD